MLLKHPAVEFAPPARRASRRVAEPLILLLPESGSAENRNAQQKAAFCSQAIQQDNFWDQEGLMARSMRPKSAQGSTRPRSLSCWVLPP